MTDRKADSPEHESKCQRCGVCCRAAVGIKDGRHIVVPGLTCVYFGIRASNGRPTCTVYADRFEKAPWCLHSEEASVLGGLSIDCAYRMESSVKGEGKEMVPDAEFDRLWPEIAETILATPNLNTGFTWGAFCEKANERDREWTWKFEIAEDGLRVTREKSGWSKLWTRGEV